MRGATGKLAAPGRRVARRRSRSGEITIAISIPALLALVLSNPPTVPALSDSGWVGKRVVQKESGFALKIERETIDPKKRIEVYRVQSVDGNLLWLTAPGIRGWVPAASVVELDQAFEHFNNAIRADSRNVHAYVMRALVQQARVRPGLGEAVKATPLARAFRSIWADYTMALALDPQNAVAYHYRGNAWSAMREYGKALDDFNAAIKIDPNSAAVYISRGNAWACKGDYDKAIADYSEAIRTEPGNTVAFLSQGSAWCAYARLRPSPERYKNAINCYNAALGLQPWNASAYIGRGAVWLSKEDYDRAIGDYSEAIRLDPEASTAYSELGNAWRAENDYDVNRDFARAYIKRALALTGDKRYDEARQDLDVAIRLDPKNPLGYLHRGSYRGFHVFPEDARVQQTKDLNQALQLDPQLAAAYAYRGKLYSPGEFWAGTFKYDGQELADFSEATRLDHTMCAAYLSQPYMWLDREECDKAIKVLNQRIQADGEDLHAYYKRGVIRSGNQEYDKAIQDFSAIIGSSRERAIAFLGRRGVLPREELESALNRNRAIAFVGRGLVWFAKEEYDKAIDDLREATRLEPESPVPAVFVGGVWFARGMYDKAIEAYSEAIKLAPQNTAGRVRIADASFAKRDLTRALQDYSEILRMESADTPYRARLLYLVAALERVRIALMQYHSRGYECTHVMLIGHFAARKAGNLGVARAFLDAAATMCDAAAWPYPVVRFLKGEIDEAALLTAASDDVKGAGVGRYLGLECALRRQLDAARSHFDRIDRHTIEYALAFEKEGSLPRLPIIRAPSPRRERTPAEILDRARQLEPREREKNPGDERER
jgi:tetratricopeptide (TPR) repeat protein